MFPQARTDQLLVQELDQEVMVYDTERHRAHTLNQSAALLWRHCDGKTAPDDLARLLAEKTGLPAEPDVVWVALEELSRAHLLRSPVTRPAGSPKCSRREMARRFARSAGVVALLPAVLSISAPTPAYAVSCKTAGMLCTLNSQCCSLNCYYYGLYKACT